MKDKLGIYKIQNILDNKIYIGSAQNFRKRWNNHKSLLRRDKHHCVHLQRAWNKYGEESFQFLIIEECVVETLFEKEQYYLDNLKPEYNSCPNATDHRGYMHTQESIDKIRLSNLGLKKIWSEEALNIRRESLKKNPLRKGKVNSLEHNDKIRIASTGIEKSSAARLNMSLARGKKVIQKSLQGETLAEFHSLNEVHRQLGFSPDRISKQIKLGKPCCGYMWEFQSLTIV